MPTLQGVLDRMQSLGEVMSQHGTRMALSLAMLIAGLLLIRLIDKGLRPLFPSMPFKVGNTIKAGDLLGKVEAITFLNTRLRTFDGKTFEENKMKFSLLNKVMIAMLAIALFSPWGTTAAETSRENRPWEKFGIQAGYFLAAVDSGIRLGTGIGVDIDVEDLLELDASNSVFRVGALWRFTDNRRHRLDLSWFSLNRDGSRKIGQAFTFENVNGDLVTVDAGTEISAFFDLDIYQIAYSYSFLQDDRIDLAGSLGLYIMPIDAGLTVSGLVEERGRANFTAPLPVLGLRMDVALTPHWFFRSGAQAFYLEYENFVGHVLQASAAVEYAPWKHVGIGLGFDTLGVSVEAEDEDWPGVDFNGKINFDYTGLQLYLRCFF